MSIRFCVIKPSRAGLDKKITAEFEEFVVVDPKSRFIIRASARQMANDQYLMILYWFWRFCRNGILKICYFLFIYGRT